MWFPILAAISNPEPVAPTHVWVTIGTYTSPGGSNGVYEASLNLETGALGDPVLRAEVANPSFVAWHPSGKFAYAVNESTGSEATAYAVTTKVTSSSPERVWSKLNTQSWKGGGPCHISVSADGKWVFGADYGAGTFASLPVRTDGSLGAAVTVFQNTGTGPDKGRQESPHAHAIVPDPKLPVVYGCDLGTDEIVTFRLGPKGELTTGNPKAGKTVPGGGPRHIALHPNGKWAYVNNEMLCSVTRFDRDPKTGTLTIGSTLSTLPPGVSPKGFSTAEIFLHPNGKFLYVTNRGHNTLAVFQIATDGALKTVEIAPAEVRTPRGAWIDPTGKWIVIAGQDSNDVTTLKVDPKTGKVQPTGHRISVSKPVSIAFSPQ